MTDSPPATLARSADSDSTWKDTARAIGASAARNRVLLTVAGAIAVFAAYFLVTAETLDDFSARTMPYGTTATPEAASATAIAAAELPRMLLGGGLLIAAVAWLLVGGSREQWTRPLIVGGAGCALLPGAAIGSVALLGLAGWILYLESRPSADPA